REERPSSLDRRILRAEVVEREDLGDPGERPTDRQPDAGDLNRARVHQRVEAVAALDDLREETMNLLHPIEVRRADPAPDGMLHGDDLPGAPGLAHRDDVMLREEADRVRRRDGPGLRSSRHVRYPGGASPPSTGRTTTA